MWKCTENYSVISDDLVDRCQDGLARNDLALLLKYYSHGLRRTLNSVPDDAIYLSIKNGMKASLNEIDINLLACGIQMHQ